jgi:hypothetical protein
MPEDHPDDLRLRLCPPLPERSDDFDDIRRAIEVVIRPHVPEYERTIGLTRSGPQFLEDLVEAILLCILVAKAPPERLSGTHKKLLSISEDAQAAADILHRLDSAVQQTTVFYPDIRRRFMALGKEAPKLRALSTVARAHADMLLPDKGGQEGMIAFRTLVKALARTFESATGRPAKVTWNPSEDRYEGKFFNLFEAVFAIAVKLCPKMPHPRTARARGRIIHEITRTPRQPHANRKRKIGRKRTSAPRLTT